MADIFETRCVSEHFQGAPNLLRVACIGDSLTYGQGVLPRESLPAQLTRCLNATFAEHLVFVDNFGQTSGNLWHAWPLMKRRGETMDFDAVVFPVFRNELKVFESTRVAYPVDPHPLWQPATPQRAAARALLADMAEVSRARGWQILIFYYGHEETDGNAMDALDADCRAAGLTPSNVTGFLRNILKTQNLTYSTSPEDHHPCAAIHAAVAQFLATELFERGVLQTRKRLHDAGAAAPEAIAALTAGGVALDVALDWSKVALEAKAVQAQPLPAIKSAAAHWQKARRVEARLASPTAVPKLWTEFLPNFHAGVRVLYELTELLCSDAVSQHHASLAGLFANGFFVGEGKLAAFAGDPVERFAAVRARIEKRRCQFDLSPDCGSLVAALPPDLGQQLDPMGGDAALKLVRQEIRRLAQMLRELEARSGAGRVPADPKHHAWIIWAVAYRYCITVAGHLDAVCTAVFDGMADCATSHSHWLRVDVELASPREYAGSAQLYKFYLEATYDLPAQIRRREGVAVRAGSENRLCSFELPFMAKGTLTAGLGPRDSARFRYLDGMARIVRISVQPGGEEATSTKPRIWQNTATERANVTLNLGPDHLTLA